MGGGDGVLEEVVGAEVKYETVLDGEWVQPIRHGYRMKCCDCGLVHRVDYRIVKYAGGRRAKMQFRAWRDDRATALTRRGRKKK